MCVCRIQTLKTINIVGACFSLAGASFIIICFISFKQLRTLSFRLVFYLGVAEFFNAIWPFFGKPEEGSSERAVMVLPPLGIDAQVTESVLYCV